MDAFTVAEDLLGDMVLSPDQLAQLRAINYQFHLDVVDILRGSGRDVARGHLTEGEVAGLRRKLEADILELLEPGQRRSL